MKLSKTTSRTVPRILFYDIETSPNIGYYYGRKYEANILAKLKHSDIFSFSYKWRGTREIWCYTQEERNEEKLIRILHKLFQDSDLIIAHYGDQFDLKVVRARMIFYGLQPPKIMTTVDTKAVASRYFKFDGNSLDELGDYLGLGRKVKVSVFDLWLECMKGSRKAWDDLARYNKQDVNLLERVYDKFLPWIESHPNIARILNPEEKSDGKCPKCGSDNCERRGYRATKASTQRQWVCRECGGWFLQRITV